MIYPSEPLRRPRPAWWRGLYLVDELPYGASAALTAASFFGLAAGAALAAGWRSAGVVALAAAVAMIYLMAVARYLDRVDRLRHPAQHRMLPYAVHDMGTDAPIPTDYFLAMVRADVLDD